MSWVLTGFGTEQRAVIGYADFWIMPRGRDSGRFLLALDDGRSGVLFGLNTVDGIFFIGVALSFLVIALIAAYPPSGERCASIPSCAPV